MSVSGSVSVRVCLFAGVCGVVAMVCVGVGVRSMVACVSRDAHASNRTRGCGCRCGSGFVGGRTARVWRARAAANAPVGGSGWWASSRGLQD